MKLYGPSYANIGAVYTLEPLTRAQIILIRMTPPLWVASFVLYGINNRRTIHIIVLYRDFKLLQVCTNYETGVA